MYRTLLALAVLAGACSSDRTPSEACARYLDAVARADLASAYAMLAAPTRERLERAALAWQRGDASDPLIAPGTPFPEAGTEPGLAVFRACILGVDGQRAPPLPTDAGRRVGATRISGDTAHVAVALRGAASEIALVREEGDWRVALDLP